MSKGKTAKKSDKNKPTIIKKYANRRLYDTGGSSYVTLDDLCKMVKQGQNFVVQDAKTGKDITRGVLTQIIVDQESRGENLLPPNFLRTLIGLYGNNFQGILPGYLEQTMDMFVKNQEHMRGQINKSLEGMRNMSGMAPMENMFTGSNPALEEMQRKNMEMFERTMKMMTQFPMYGTDNKDQTEES